MAKNRNILYVDRETFRERQERSSSQKITHLHIELMREKREREREIIFKIIETIGDSSLTRVKVST